jgi:hypothetical protein
MSLPILLNQQLIDIPLSWNELTLAQYTRMYNATQSCNDTLAPIAALLKIDKHTLQSLPEDKLQSTVLKNLLWLNEPPPNITAEHCPKYLQIGDELHTIPQSFDGLKFGQVLLFQSVLSEHTDKETGALKPAAYARLLAIVFSAQDGPINDAAIDQLEAQLQQTPFTEAMPVLNFFLSCWQHLNNASTKPLTAKAPPKKSRRELSALKNLGLTHWYAWLCRPKTLRTTKH